MFSTITQDILEKLPVEIVDDSMEPIGSMLYSTVCLHAVKYVRIASIFVYDNAVLLSREPSGAWGVTLDVPLIFGKAKEEMVDEAMATYIGIKGSRATLLHTVYPSRIQPYFYLYYKTSIPYTLHTKWDMRQRRFVEQYLLQQSVLLEPNVFSSTLIELLEYSCVAK